LHNRFAGQRPAKKGDTMLDFKPKVLADSQDLQFMLNVKGEPVLARITLECLRDTFSCEQGEAEAAVACYLANKAKIDGKATDKVLAGEEPTVESQDF
jgi:hypothetical protein